MYLISKLLLIKIPCWFPSTSGLLEYLFNSLGCWQSVRGDRSRSRGCRSALPPHHTLLPPASPAVSFQAHPVHLRKGTCYLSGDRGVLMPRRGEKEPPEQELFWVIPKPHPTCSEIPPCAGDGGASQPLPPCFCAGEVASVAELFLLCLSRLFTDSVAQQESGLPVYGS